MSGMRQLEIRTRRMVNDSLAGAYHSVFKGRGMDFDEVREYTPGDEVRTIDWNVTARAGRTFVKKFTEERELTILLLVDISASGNFGSGAKAKRDLAAELASVLAFSAIRNSDKVGLVLYTDRIERYLPPRRGGATCCAWCATFCFTRRRARHRHRQGARRGESPAASARHRLPDLGFRRAGRPGRGPRGAVPRHAPDQPPPRSGGRARRGSARAGAPDVGILALEDAETGEVIELDTASAAVRKRFKAAAEERRRRLVIDFRSEGVDTLQLRTDTPYIPALQRFFKTRERRRA